MALKITKNQGSIQVTADKSGFYPFDGTITFPTNSLFTATSANTDMITFKSTSNGDVQFVGNYKDITISGRSYDTKQKFLTAFSNLANQGSVDAYTKAETDAKLNDKLTAKTNANGALFISSSSNDDANSSVALYNSYVNGTNDVAIGFASTPHKDGMHNLAILHNAQANGLQNIAIGDQRRCNGIQNVGIGCGKLDTVDVNGQCNVCIGANSQAQTPTPDNAAVNNSIAIGSSANAYDNYCTVVGSSASSVGSHSVVIGDSAHADSVGSWSVAVGSNARAYGKNSVALGYLSCATNDKPLDICCGKSANNSPLRVIQSDANGKISLLKGDGTIERMVIQDEIEALKNAGGGGSANPLVNVKGMGSATIPDNVTEAVAIGSGASVTNDSCIAIGKDTSAQAPTGRSSIVIGSNTTIDRNDANGIAIGSNTTIEGGRNLIVIGNSSDAWSSEGVVIGSNSHANCQGCVSIGSNRNLQGDYNVAIGQSTGSRFGGTNGIAIGYDSNIGVPNAAGAHYYDIAIGDEAYANGTCAVAIGRKATASDETPLFINAGYKTVDNVKQPLTVLQSDSTGKLSILKGDGTDERIVIQDALSAGGSGGGTVDAYTKTETDTKLEAKQDKLTAGSGITIDENNVISSTGGSGGTVDGLVIDANKVAAGLEQYVSNSYDLVVIGNKAEAHKPWSVVIGQEAKCRSNDSIIIGKNAESNVNGAAGSVVIGNDAKSSARYGLSIGQYAEANDTTPLVIKAGVDIAALPLTMIQGDANGKISLLKGDGTDERMVIQDEIAALKNAGGSGGGSVDAYTKTETDTKLEAKQDKLTAGSGITITKDETAGTSTIATAVSLTDNGNGAYTVGNSIKMGNCIAIGEYAYSYDRNSVAVGSDAHASAEGAVAIGHYSVATKDTPLVIRAGYKIVGNSKKNLTVLQSDANGKISIIKGDDPDERIVISDEITALKAEITTLKAEIAALKGGA